MVNRPPHILILFRLIRWPNLMIAAASQIVLKYCIINPVLIRMNMVPQMPNMVFALLVLGTVCIAAGGYIINDYFDRKIDRINKPDQMIVGKYVYPRYAMVYHIILSFTGILCGLYVALRIHEVQLSLIFFLVSGLLWFYSTTYKQQLLLGNVIVALLTALVPFIVLLFELPLIAKAYGSEAQSATRVLMTWVTGFSVFAFLLNLLREIVKDTEDLEGDMAYGKQTVPVIWGVQYARWISAGLIISIITLIILSWIFFLRDYITLVYFALLIVLPLAVIAVLIIRGEGKSAYHRASNMIKMVMVAGLGYMIVANLLMKFLQ